MAMVNQISENCVSSSRTRAADFHRSDHVPTADGHRYLAREGNFATGSPDPG